MAERAASTDPDRDRSDGVSVAQDVARREIEIEAAPEEVFEALLTEEGRERWLEEPEREIHIEVVQAPSRLVWWWAGEEESATRVEFEIVAVPNGARVVVTECEPTIPLVRLAASFALALA